MTDLRVGVFPGVNFVTGGGQPRIGFRPETSTEDVYATAPKIAKILDLVCSVLVNGKIIQFTPDGTIIGPKDVEQEITPYA